MQLVCEVKWLNPFYIPGAGTAMATATQARTIGARLVGRESDLQMNNRWWTTGCCWLYSQPGTFFHVSQMCLGYVGNVWLDHGVHWGQSHEYPHHFLWSLTDGAIYHASDGLVQNCDISTGDTTVLYQVIYIMPRHFRFSVKSYSVLMNFRPNLRIVTLAMRLQTDTLSN